MMMYLIAQLIIDNDMNTDSKYKSMAIKAITTRSETAHSVAQTVENRKSYLSVNETVLYTSVLSCTPVRISIISKDKSEEGIELFSDVVLRSTGLNLWL